VIDLFHILDKVTDHDGMKGVAIEAEIPALRRDGLSYDQVLKRRG
jgi:hypothetical protein